MRRLSRYLIVGTVLATAGVAGTYVAYADWTLPATSMTVALRAAAMPKGTKPSVAEQSHTAVVSWSAQEIAAGVKMDHYLVTAHNQDETPKPTIVKEVVATGNVSESVIFSAAEVSGSKWRWTVTPRFASWTGAESGLSKAIKFDPAPAAVLVEAPASKVAAPAAVPTAPAPTAESPSKPGAEPVTTTPAPSPPEKTEDDTAPPPASSPAEAKPATTAAEPSASGSADEGIPE